MASGLSRGRLDFGPGFLLGGTELAGVDGGRLTAVGGTALAAAKGTWTG